ncbi:5430_t:CDS:1, partial [Cetraspora pellucida]
MVYRVVRYILDTKNPAQHKKQDQAHYSLAKELNILSEVSDQRVVEKVSLLKKQLK